ncbi:hypothetical protein JKP88DRAFT_285886 [Tribonema minus]|uniref:Uncharacterized protein n=1 Tax=Tribonema minus TaxID=303371 RepID=A0A835ZEF7_9STRA|nr:hypothetical protein JKP88DRAFT_285886 [Tribonema minus]
MSTVQATMRRLVAVPLLRSRPRTSNEPNTSSAVPATAESVAPAVAAVEGVIAAAPRAQGNSPQPVCDVAAAAAALPVGVACASQGGRRGHESKRARKERVHAERVLLRCCQLGLPRQAGIVTVVPVTQKARRERASIEFAASLYPEFTPEELAQAAAAAAAADKVLTIWKVAMELNGFTVVDTDDNGDCLYEALLTGGGGGIGGLRELFRSELAVE